MPKRRGGFWPPAATERSVRFEVPRTGRMGGLNLYGARMGAFPVDPTLFIDL